MKTGSNYIDREKVSHIISEMLFMILGFKVIHVDQELVDQYIDSILRMEENTPLKELLLLQKSFIESYTYITVQPVLGIDFAIDMDENII